MRVEVFYVAQSNRNKGVLAGGYEIISWRQLNVWRGIGRPA